MTAADEGASRGYVAELRFEEEDELLKPEPQEASQKAAPEEAPPSGDKYAALKWLASSAGGRHWLAGALGWWLFIFTAVSRPSSEAAPPSVVQAPQPATSLTFMVIGDWGRQGGPFNQTGSGVWEGLEVAASLGAVAARVGAAFVVSTGDNVYSADANLTTPTWKTTAPVHGNGIANVADPFWKATFTNVYTHPALQCPWYAVMGNHDWTSPANVTAQVDPALESRWHGTLGGRTDHYANPSDPTPLLSIFYVDTTPWILGYRADGLNKFNFTAATQGKVTPDSPYDSLAGRAAFWEWEDAQVAALAGELRASGARWKLVVGHHPMYSYAGQHKSTGELARLNGVLRRGGAHGYLNGHDHNLQMVQPGRDGPFYITSGSGSKLDTDPIKVPQDGSLLFGQVAQGFNSFSVNATTLSLTFHGRDGTALFSSSILWTPPPQCQMATEGLLGCALPADSRCGPPPAPATLFDAEVAASPLAPPVMDSYTRAAPLPFTGGAAWDYVSFDNYSSTVFMGRRQDGLCLAHFAPGQEPPLRDLGCLLPATVGANGVVLMHDRGLAMSVNAKSIPGSATLFQLPHSSATQLSQFKVLGTFQFPLQDGGPDAGLYHPGNSTISFTFTARNASLTGSRRSALITYKLSPSINATSCGITCLINVSGTSYATASAGLLEGGLEAPHLANPANPGDTSAWLALEGGSLAARVDLFSMKVLQTMDLRAVGCSTPAGLDVDASRALLFVACRGGKLQGNMGVGVPMLVAFNTSAAAATQPFLYSSLIGKHVDGLVYAPPSGNKTGRLFLSCGADAVILVFEVADNGRVVRPMEGIATMPGAKTLAVDPVSRAVFTVAPRGSRDLTSANLSVGVPEAALSAESFYPNVWQNGSYTLLAFTPTK